ncbi:hypothetical protein [Rhizobium sp. G21]|uniref:hypothetical protein n=1 Tax=Rhizobium sp. G21 TaxID=2758439 RepID=UPI0015FF6CCB|nr:hypothetical protein [Rhizobium sp. G21]MBB1251317.1 hypothetical protein [Rhizobium sp. G21]
MEAAELTFLVVLCGDVAAAGRRLSQWDVVRLEKGESLRVDGDGTLLEIEIALAEI